MLHLRRATAADAPELEYVAELAYSPYLPRMDGLRPMPMDADYAAAVVDSEAWVAFVGEEVVGFALLVAEDDVMLLENVAVLPSHHGTGVGRALLELAEERSRAAGLARVRLYTHESMVENQRLYEHIGYIETHRESEHGRTRVFFEKSIDLRSGAVSIAREVSVLESAEVDVAARAELRRLWTDAFGDRFDDHDAEHAFGGVHVLVRDGGHLVGHASAVPRQIRFGEQPWRTVAYVEAVATDPARQGEGIGRSTMERLQDEIASRWEIAMLSTGRATGFYEQLGWQRWLGLSYTQTEAGVVLDGEHGGLMVFTLRPAATVDRTLSVTCRDRAGDAW